MFKRSVVLLLVFLIGISMIGALFISPKIKESKIAGSDKIAIIYVDGMIVGGRGQVGLFTEGGGAVAKTRPLKKMQTRSLTGSPSYVKLEVRKPTDPGA